MAIRRSEYLHDTRKLLLLILSGEKRISRPEFGQNAAQGPHVNAEAIAAAQNDFRASIESGLNVRVHLFFLLAAAAEIDHSYVCLASFANENIFRFQVAVDDSFVLQKDQTGKKLPGEASNERKRKPDEVVGTYQLV